MATTIHERNVATKTTPSASHVSMPPIILRLRPVVDLTPDQLLELSALNRDVRLELTAQGELIVMSPTGGRSGGRNLALAGLLWTWTQQNGTGIAFDSSTGFTLRDNAVRSPDAAWIQLSRWNALSPDQQEQYPPLCPDFVVELHSKSDTVGNLRAKMEEWLKNGVPLGWLIDPYAKRVYVYRPDAPVEELQNPETISGEPVLPGFVLDLRKVW